MNRGGEAGCAGRKTPGWPPEIWVPGKSWACLYPEEKVKHVLAFGGFKPFL